MQKRSLAGPRKDWPRLEESEVEERACALGEGERDLARELDPVSMLRLTRPQAISRTYSVCSVWKVLGSQPVGI